MAEAKKKPRAAAKASPIVAASDAALLHDIRELIDTARAKTATAVNAAWILLYWSIGDRIRRDILKRVQFTPDRSRLLDAAQEQDRIVFRVANEKQERTIGLE